jgi:hypothetical protein
LYPGQFLTARYKRRKRLWSYDGEACNRWGANQMPLNNPAYRILRNIVVIMVAVVMAMVAFSAYRAMHERARVKAGLVPTGLPFLPAPPTGVGCYYQKTGDVTWQSVPCLSPSEVSKLHREQADTTLVATNSNGSLVSPTSRATSLVEGVINVQFIKFSGETDNLYGPNKFSIQANSNTFTGNNGDLDWVQFTYTNTPPGPLSDPDVCVWQEDLTVDAVNPSNSTQGSCLPTVATALSSAWFGYLQGITYDVPSCQFPFWRLGCRKGFYQLAAEIRNPAGTWAVTAPDDFGLSVNWNEISGTVVGSSKGSQAQFRSPTFINVATSAYAPWLNSVAYTNLGGITAETNNLELKFETSQCMAGECTLITDIGN